MYIIKNALRNITRVKARNILIGIIIFIVAISSCVALSIKNSSNKLIQSYIDSSNIEGEISLNRESMRNDAMKKREQQEMSSRDFMQNIEKLDLEKIKEYGNSEYVKEYYYWDQTELNSSNITKATIDITENIGKEMNIPQDNGIPGGNFNNMSSPNSKVKGDFAVIGYSSLNAMSEFIDGTYKIVNGEMINIETTEYECIIAEDLAEENSLEIGSKIELMNPNNEEEKYEFTVKGIYSDSSESKEFTMFSNAANQIITSYNVLNNIINNSSSNIDTALTSNLNVKFILQNKDVIENFEAELKQKGLSDYYQLTTNVESLEQNLKAIKNLESFATTFLIIVLVIGIVILTVINMINIRERKYEIGVLRSIGMKKSLVLAQFVIEIFIVTAIAVVIGTIIGTFITVPISNSLLKSEVESLNSERNQINKNFGMQDGDVNRSGMIKMENKRDIRNTFGADTSYIDKINVVVDIKTVSQLALISILITVISSSISMIFISRYTPIKILSNRT